jgi:hypothetical protein
MSPKTKSKTEPEVVHLLEIACAPRQRSAIGTKLIAISGIIGVSITIYGILTLSFPMMFCGTILISVATFAAN